MGKTEPVVIADAGPVIHLDELGCLYLLADFGFTYSPCLAGRGDYQRRS
jgi:hypothetical protein